jgi:hypothetical protein
VALHFRVTVPALNKINGLCHIGPRELKIG